MPENLESTIRRLNVTEGAGFYEATGLLQHRSLLHCPSCVLDEFSSKRLFCSQKFRAKRFRLLFNPCAVFLVISFLTISVILSILLNRKMHVRISPQPENEIIYTIFSRTISFLLRSKIKIWSSDILQVKKKKKMSYSFG